MSGDNWLALAFIFTMGSSLPFYLVGEPKTEDGQPGSGCVA